MRVKIPISKKNLIKFCILLIRICGGVLWYLSLSLLANILNSGISGIWGGFLCITWSVFWGIPLFIMKLLESRTYYDGKVESQDVFACFVLGGLVFPICAALVENDDFLDIR